MADPLRPGTDPSTLQEVDVDTTALTARVQELVEASGTAALGERADALRLLGRLDEADACARRAVAAAVEAGDARDIARARIRLGQVLHRRSLFAEAEEEFAAAVSDAEQVGDERLRAAAIGHRGRSRFDEGRTVEAERDFTTALQIQRRIGAPDEEISASEQAVAAAMSRLVAARHR